MKIYLSVAEMSAQEQLQRVNVFSLTLRFYENQFSDVITALQSALMQLNRKIKLMINEEKILICIYTTAFIKNMSQQQVNSDFLFQNVNQFC